jgi:hypothetical protein
MWTTGIGQREGCGLPIEVQVSPYTCAHVALCKVCEAMHTAASTPYFERAEQESMDLRKRLGLD